VLAEYWASHYARKIGQRIRGIAPGALEAMMAYPWPGNVREMQHVVERAVILARGEVLDAADFELQGPRPSVPATSRPAPSGPAGDADERRRIEAALRAARGRISGVDGAAQALGVPSSTLESRIQRLGIDKLAFRRRSPEPGHGASGAMAVRTTCRPPRSTTTSTV